MSGMNELEREIEESRARLDRTIDRIQDKLSVPSLVDEVLGSARRTPLSEVYDAAVETVRRNPVPVLLIAAGVGWLMKRTADRTARGLEASRFARTSRAAGEVATLNDGAARTYDPDRPTSRPAGGVSVETKI